LRYNRAFGFGKRRQQVAEHGVALPGPGAPSNSSQSARTSTRQAPTTTYDYAEIRDRRSPLTQATQQHRLQEIIANLHDRLNEARTQGWQGEIEGLETSVSAAEQKLASMPRQHRPRHACRSSA
jgi:hypothetical protein